MANIINPYRFGSSGGGGGSDYVTISTSATINTDSYDYDYKYIEFDSTTSSAFQVTDAGSSSGSDSIELYVIGGGGGGGAQTSNSNIGTGGGGGAGGFIRQTSFTNGSSLVGTYDVTIGAGGGGGSPNSTQSTSGSDSQVVKQGERSIDFDGSNDYLETGSTSDFNFGTGDFCIEFWMNPAQIASSYELLIATENSSGARWQIYQESDAISFWGYNSSGTYVRTATAASAVAVNKWHHVAVTRNSGTLTIFVDGKSEATSTSYSSYDFSDDDGLTVGAASAGAYHYEGKMLGVRVVNGSAVYTAAFNPPMEKLTAITNTKLLINPTTSQSTWTDSSASGHTLTGSGWSNFSSSLDSETPLMRGFGGGHAASYSAQYAAEGGSGGGGAYSPNAGASGFNGQGYSGGNGDYGGTYIHGGGGGAGGNGSNGSSGGTGGDGWTDSGGWMYYNSLGPDSDGYFAGGGGGARGSYNGGSGGGGSGGQYSSDAGTDGSTNSGGGGGGAGKSNGASNVSNSGGGGGSGKVIVRWKYQN
tara:strand:- start:1423 stop:3012 length:1590 start_codon:yes stop_codon:yes gene_type:complete